MAGTQSNVQRLIRIPNQRKGHAAFEAKRFCNFCSKTVKVPMWHIQQTLNTHPSVRECTVFGSDISGEGTAYIVRKGKQKAPNGTINGPVLQDFIDISFGKGNGGRISIEFVRNLPQAMERTAGRILFDGIMRAIFKSIDCNSDGLISHKEAAECFTKDIKLFSNVNTANDYLLETTEQGSLSLTQFKNLILEYGMFNMGVHEKRKYVEEYLLDIITKHIFDKADVNSSGLLSLSQVLKLVADYELSSSLPRLSFFEYYDLNGDGKVDYYEFRKLILDFMIVGQDEECVKESIIVGAALAMDKKFV